MSDDRPPPLELEAPAGPSVAWTGGLIDTHAHLDDPSFEGAVGDVLREAAAVGVRRVINIGYRPARWETTRGLAAAHPAIRFALGVHPSHADEWTPAVEADLRAALVSSGQSRSAKPASISSAAGRRPTSSAKCSQVRSSWRPTWVCP
jgi:Tat protein secretion system quality control protein TatD with DNase activity